MQHIAPDYDHVGNTLSALNKSRGPDPAATAQVGSAEIEVLLANGRGRQRAESDHTELEIFETRYAESAREDLLALQQEASAE